MPEKRPRGRPRAELPGLLVDYALAAWLKHGSWSLVFEQLATGGFRSLPRMTLQRHVLRRKAELDVQASDPCHY